MIDTTPPTARRPRHKMTESELAYDNLVRENAALELQVKRLERKLAVSQRAIDQRALHEREKFVTALSQEVDAIRDRILARIT